MAVTILHKSDIDFLLKYLDDGKICHKLENVKRAGDIVVNNKYSTGRYKIHFLLEEIETLRNFLMHFLVSFGLNENDEPNLVGIYVESLIDMFSVHHP